MFANEAYPLFNAKLLFVGIYLHAVPATTFPPVGVFGEFSPIISNLSAPFLVDGVVQPILILIMEFGVMLVLFIKTLVRLSDGIEVLPSHTSNYPK